MKNKNFNFLSPLFIQKFLGTKLHLQSRPKNFTAEFYPYLYGFRYEFLVRDIEKIFVHFNYLGNLFQHFLKQKKGVIIFIGCPEELEKLWKKLEFISNQKFLFLDDNVSFEYLKSIHKKKRISFIFFYSSTQVIRFFSSCKNQFSPIGGIFPSLYKFSDYPVYGNFTTKKGGMFFYMFLKKILEQNGNIKVSKI